MDELSLMVLIIVVGAVVIIAAIAIIAGIRKSPFKFPYFRVEFDVTGKKLPKIEDYIDDYIIKYKMSLFNFHLNTYKEWQKKSQELIEKSPIKKIRQKQYDECLDVENMFVFVFVKKQTRYSQHNYVKSAYYVMNDVSQFSASYSWLAQRYKRLEKINFETNLSTYRDKDQRKLMTKELRELIAIRDNYTCQICGKYMPDGVGLHIDHIVPVSKGGKSVPSNLQVLCSKCNGQKSNK